MIHTFRRLAITERHRMLLAGIASVMFMLLMVVVFDQIGTAAFKGTQDVESFAKGFDIRAFTTPDAILANLIGVALTHPLFLAMIGSIAIALGARSCAGELQDGTIELTLARPISRRTYLLSYLAFNNLAIILLLAISMISIPIVGELIDSKGSLTATALLETTFEGWLFFASFASLTTMLSTFVRTRSGAMTAAIAILVGTYFLEFFARLWSEMEFAGYFSPFHYFTPTDTLLGQGIVWSDAAALAGVALVAAVIALIQFERRDLA